MTTMRDRHSGPMIGDIGDFAVAYLLLGHLAVFLFSLVVGIVAFGWPAWDYAVVVTILSAALSSPVYLAGRKPNYVSPIDAPIEKYLFGGLFAGVVLSILLIVVARIWHPDRIVCAFVLAGLSFLYAASKAFLRIRELKKAQTK